MSQVTPEPVEALVERVHQAHAATLHKLATGEGRTHETQFNAALTELAERVKAAERKVGGEDAGTWRRWYGAQTNRALAAEAQRDELVEALREIANYDGWGHQGRESARIARAALAKVLGE